MKKTNQFICKCLMIVSILLFQSCDGNRMGEDDPENGPSYEISGQLFQDCSKQPMANKPIDLFQEIQHNWDNSTDGGVLATTTTDTNGFFKFVFKDKNGGEESIRYQAGAGYNEVLEKIPNRTSLDSLIIFNNPSTNIQVSLNVINPYTANDTLNIVNLNTNQWMRIPGPFLSGILYTAIDLPLLGMYFDEENKKLTWYFNSDNQNFEDIDFEINTYCNDTIFVTADIN